MSKVVAIMSMSLDGYVADPDDGVAEVFDWGQCSQRRWFKVGEGALFLRAPSLGRFGDPAFDRAGDFALALRPGLFTPAGRYALRASGLAALYDSHSIVHGGE